jgi:hypothetical protein
MDATTNNTIITLTNAEVKEAILNYAFKNKPALRPIGLKPGTYPHILINTASIGAAMFIDSHDITDNTMMAMVLVPSEEDCVKLEASS